jgi:hypothetical protein
MADIEKPLLFDSIKAQVDQMGGTVKTGVISRSELEDAMEIRVSIRLHRHIGSTELFTLRNISPNDYHLMLIAVPRKTNSNNILSQNTL